jgi:hypothetical protein
MLALGGHDGWSKNLLRISLKDSIVTGKAGSGERLERAHTWYNHALIDRTLYLSADRGVLQELVSQVSNVLVGRDEI